METLTLARKIRKIVTATTGTKADQKTAKTALACLDLTSLNDTDTDQTIINLCAKAIDGNVASVCVYPQFVSLAAEQLKNTDIGIATVINFPNGNTTNDGVKTTADNTESAVRQAIADGATEIDIVVDYQGFHNMEADLIRQALSACRDACGDNVKMKVILETSAFHFEREVYDLAKFAMDHGADMVKTSTGKHENGGATPEMVAAMMLAIKDYKNVKQVGLKISGGVNGANYADYMSMVEKTLGSEYMTPDMFRFGASGLYDSLIQTNDAKPVSKTTLHAPSGY